MKKRWFVKNIGDDKKIEDLYKFQKDKDVYYY